MGKISRRGLFGLGAAIAVIPALPKAKVAKGAAFDGMRVRIPSDYAPIKVGDVITFNDEPPRTVVNMSMREFTEGQAAMLAAAIPMIYNAKKSDG